MDYSPADYFVHGILQARILEWVTISSFRGSSWPRDQNRVSWTAGRLFTLWATRRLPSLCFGGAEVAKSCPTLVTPIDCKRARSTVHGAFQARILEWVAIFFSKWSSQPMDQTRFSYIAGRFFTDWATREFLSLWLGWLQISPSLRNMERIQP